MNEIKELYKRIIRFEEMLQKRELPILVKREINSIRNKYADIFDKEIYEDIQCPHCGISRLKHHWINNDDCMVKEDE